MQRKPAGRFCGVTLSHSRGGGGGGGGGEAGCLYSTRLSEDRVSVRLGCYCVLCSLAVPRPYQTGGGGGAVRGGHQPGFRHEV